MVALVRPLSAVLPGELDPAALDLVYGADVDAIGANDFHMLLDIGHSQVPSSVALLRLLHSWPTWHHEFALGCHFMLGLDVDDGFGKLGERGIRCLLFIKRRLQES